MQVAQRGTGNAVGSAQAAQRLCSGARRSKHGSHTGSRLQSRQIAHRPCMRSDAGRVRAASGALRIGSIYCRLMVETEARIAPPEAFDAPAAARVGSRLAQQQPPWLHGEVARRMAERLPIIRQPPARWLDWWAHLGAGAAAVRAAYPDAQRIAVEPDALWRERSAASLPHGGRVGAGARRAMRCCCKTRCSPQPPRWCGPI